MFRVRCQNCGKEFLGRRNQSFCSKACKNDFRYQQKSKFTIETRGRPRKEAVKAATKAAEALKLRRERQQKASELGLTYGQYVALFKIEQF